jgi:hypothetical protein
MEIDIKKVTQAKISHAADSVRDLAAQVASVEAACNGLGTSTMGHAKVNVSVTYGVSERAEFNVYIGSESTSCSIGPAATARLKEALAAYANELWAAIESERQRVEQAKKAL